MSTQLPRRIPQALRHQCLFRPSSIAARPFSSTPCALRGGGGQRVFAAQAEERREAFFQMQQAQQVTKSPFSVNQAMQQGFGEQLGFDDVGALPATFIRAPWSKLPSLFGEFKQRKEYEWNWIKTRVSDLFLRLYYKWWISTLRPRPKMARRPIYKIARQLHEDIYKAFAARAENDLKDLCCTGLYTTFRRQIANRPDAEIMNWHVEKYLSSPRIVSNRATPVPFPGDKQCAMRQVIIKMHTRQVLETFIAYKRQKAAPTANSSRSRKTPAWQPKGVVDSNTENTQNSEKPDEPTNGAKTITKDVVEYMVLQRFMRRGKEGEWKVWGFLQPTTYEGLKESQRQLEELKEWEMRNPRNTA